MRTIIAFTDSVNECECCGKKGLKGTFCCDIDGVEVYYGSTCAFKKHSFTKEHINKAVKSFEANKRAEKLNAELERISKIEW